MKKLLYFLIFLMVATGVARAGAWYFGTGEATLIPSKMGHATSDSEVSLIDRRIRLNAPQGVFATSTLTVDANLLLEADKVSVPSGELTLESATNLNLNVPGPTGVINSSGTVLIINQAELRLEEEEGDGGFHYFGMRAAPSMAANVVVEMPSTAPPPNYFLRNTSAAPPYVLDWAVSPAVPIWHASTENSNITLNLANDVVLVSASPSPVTVTLSSATESSVEMKIHEIVVKENSATNTVTVAALSGQTIGINGATTVKMVEPGETLRVVADGTNWQVIQHPQQVVWIKDAKASGTQGGGLTAGSWVTRDLNNIYGNRSFLNHLTSNEFSLPPGRYRFWINVPGYRVSLHKCRLFNVSDSSVAIYGTAERSDFSAVSTTQCLLNDTVTISDTTLFRVEQRSSTTQGTDGRGRASSFSGDDEIYTQVMIERMAL